MNWVRGVIVKTKTSIWLTLLVPGGGALSAHSLANWSMLLIRCIKTAKMCLTFHIYLLRKDFIENFEFFGGGYPHFGPLKGRRCQNEHPRTTYNPTFLLHNPTLLWKWRCLQKTRAQKVKIWPRYKGFKFGKNWTKIFEKIWLRTKKCHKSASFQDFVDFCCPMRSVITPLVYIWVNENLPGFRSPGQIGLSLHIISNI